MWLCFRVWLDWKKTSEASASKADTPPDLSTPPSAGVRQQRNCLLSAWFGCRDCGYKSKNTNSDPLEGFAIHCNTSWVYCEAFLIHKAAASGAKHCPSPEDLRSTSTAAAACLYWDWVPFAACGICRPESMQKMISGAQFYASEEGNLPVALKASFTN